jgi:hypothetical protein
MSGVQTLKDITRLQNPDGSPARIAEILQDSNPILQDMAWQEGNLDTGHQFTQRTAQRHGTYTRYNEGVAIENTVEEQKRVDAARLETYSEVDKELAKLSGNVGAYRFAKAKGIMEGMSLTMGDTVFYGNSGTNPAEFTGFANLLNQTSDRNFVNGGGSGSDNTSVFAIDWGPDKCYGIYPKGSTAGLMHEDLGEDTKIKNSKYYQVYRDRFCWYNGIAVENPNATGRLANIDVSDLAGAGTSGYSGPDLINLLIELDNTFRAGYNPVFYMNRTFRTALEKIATAKNNVELRYAEYAGRKIMMFRERPIVVCDSIVNTEATVS